MIVMTEIRRWRIGCTLPVMLSVPATPLEGGADDAGIGDIRHHGNISEEGAIDDGNRDDV